MTLALFGGTISLLRDKNRNALLIDVDTPIFLFNRQTNTVFGCFSALSTIQNNYDPSAWGGRNGVSKYPAQVVIDMAEWEAADRPCVVLERKNPLYAACRKTAGGNWIGQADYLEIMHLLTCRNS